jgi:hypothetical protein
MDDVLARSFTERIIALVPVGASLLTNGGLGLWHAGLETDSGWDPVTDATFDVAVAGVGMEEIVVFWVSNED